VRCSQYDAGIRTLVFELYKGASLFQIPEGMTAKKFVEYASAYGELPTPTREGYKFLGWYT
jgi:hypothetical protein